MGTKPPPPAAITSTGATISLPASVLSFQRAVGKFFGARLAHLAEMERRLERLDLFHQAIGQLLTGHERQPRNVVDRLLGVKLGTLPTRAVENVDQMGFQIQKGPA